MASGAYQAGINKANNGTIDLDTTVLKVMLLKSSYTYDPDHDFVDDLSEIVATNYAGGYGGVGRKAATATTGVDNVNNRAKLTLGDLTWSALGGAVNDTVGGAALIFETGGSDATAVPIAFFDLTNFTTNGGDVSLDFDAVNGNLHWNC